jgi:hypothetical protein
MVNGIVTAVKQMVNGGLETHQKPKENPKTGSHSIKNTKEKRAGRV